MQKINFYCKKCRKSLGMTYELTGDENVPVLSGMTISCRTNKCIRTVTLRNFKEKHVTVKVDSNNNFYL